MPAKPLMLPRRLLAAAPTGARAFGRRTGAKAHLPPAPKRRQQPAPRRRDPPQAVARVVASAPAPPAPPPSPLDETLAALAGPAPGRRPSSPGARRAYRAAAYEAARRPGTRRPPRAGRRRAGSGRPARGGRGRARRRRGPRTSGRARRGGLRGGGPGRARRGRARPARAAARPTRSPPSTRRGRWARWSAPPRRAFYGYPRRWRCSGCPSARCRSWATCARSGVRPAAATYAALLRAAATAPQWHPAYGFLTDEILDAMEGDGVAPSAELFDALVRCAGACGDHVAAAAYFQAARRFGCAPSPARYAAYLGALARAATVGVRADAAATCPRRVRGPRRRRSGGSRPRFTVRDDRARGRPRVPAQGRGRPGDARGRGRRRRGDDADVRAALAAASPRRGSTRGRRGRRPARATTTSRPSWRRSSRPRRRRTSTR